MDASAPSARWVWPRITPGCSSNVRLTRSSNSRMRSIWVNIQIRRSSLSSAVLILGLLSSDAGANLRQRRLIGTVEFLLDWQVAKLLGQDLGAPRAGVARPVQRADIPGDVELALARELAMVDDLVDLVLHVLELSVRQLHPGDVLGGDLRQPLRVDAELAHVPGVDGQPAVGAVGLGDQAQAGLERADVGVERNDLVGDLGVGVVGRVVAQCGVLLDHLVELARGLGDVPDLDVVRVEGRGGLEQLAALHVRRLARLAALGCEEVGQELDLHVLEAVVAEHLGHLLKRGRLELVLDVRVPEPEAREPDTLGVGAAVLPAERAPFPSEMDHDRAAHGPVRDHHLDLAHRRSYSSLPGRIASYRRGRGESSESAQGVLPMSASALSSRARGRIRLATWRP